MEEISSCSARILVGIPLDAETSLEILSWAVGVAARTNDTVIASHVLVCKDGGVDKTKMRQAKAFVISMVGEFAEFCRRKKVDLEAKVVSSAAVGRGLVEDAALLEANFLVIGGLKNQSQSGSLEVTKYCFNYAPEGCLVISIGRRAHSPQYSDSDFTYEGGQLRRSNSTRSNRGRHISRALTSWQKLFSSKDKRDTSSFSKRCPSGIIHEKASPKTVLDGPEEDSQTVEDYFSLGDSSNTDSPPPPPMLEELKNSKGSSKKWKRLSGIKLIFPFLHSQFDGRGKEKTRCLSKKENKKPSWECFGYEEISLATNNFHPDNMVGKGGHSEVFRGDFPNGEIVAVKRLAKDNTDENKQKEFLSELGIVGHVCHPNTSSLIGCCIENGLHLIFNFSPNGNLATALHGENGKVLEWPVRYKIVVGIARGLHYLHKCCKHRIIHRDIKASNILLGTDFEPQISDFGLAKWLPKHWTHHSIIPIEGTFGYLAPEYFMHGIVDEKTDVFAFGVLLLEIVSGRRPVDCSKQGLLQWAKPLMEASKIAELVDPRLGANYDVNQMKRLVITASYCIRQSSIFRPSMDEVLQLLTEGCESTTTWSWTIPESDNEQLDDYTEDMDFQYPTSLDSYEDY